MNILMPERKIPVIEEADICVLGGSCTGVFAAIRAARLGAKTVIVEKQNKFGGVATNSLVNVWHSLYDTGFKKQIIAGLTLEILERLQKRNAVSEFINTRNYGIILNSEELTIELDELVCESKIKPYLHTFFSEAIIEDNQTVSAVIVENKNGRGAIKAKFFIDATGDADLCNKLGQCRNLAEHLQPPTMCAKFSDWNFPEEIDFQRLIREKAKKYNLPEGFIWGAFVPQSNVHMLAGTRVFNKNCSDANDLTFCEIEGRRQIRAIMDIFRNELPEKYHPKIQALPSQIGIRETRHIKSLHQIKGNELLYGEKFGDAVANATYPVDIHHNDKPGITFKHLDGTQKYCRPGMNKEEGRWRKKTCASPEYYQIPLRSIIPQNGPGNVISAGRMIDADHEAFGAVRVMVNLNQIGEAAGAAAHLAVCDNLKIKDVKATDVRKILSQSGCSVL